MRFFGLASIRELMKYNLECEPFKWLRHIGLTDIISGPFLYNENDYKYASLIRDSELGLIVDFPPILGILKAGPFEDAWGTKAYESPRCGRNGPNLFFDWWDENAWFEIENKQLEYAKKSGITGVVICTSSDQASWPVYWLGPVEQNFHYWCHNPIVKADMLVWAKEKYGITAYVAATPESDLEPAGLTFEYCRWKLIEVIRRIVDCIPASFELMLFHELGRPGSSWEWAGGRVGLLNEIKGIYPRGQWIFFPQCFTDLSLMPHMLYARQEMGVWARSGPWKTCVGAEGPSGIVVENAYKAGNDGHGGIVIGTSRLFDKEGKPNFKLGTQVTNCLKVAREHWEQIHNARE